MRSKFDQQLAALNQELTEMGATCAQAIGLAAQALEQQDVALAAPVGQLEEQTNEQERTIEALCLKLLLQQQPVARDLRQISAALKMITDMERIGDQAADIAEITTYLRKGRGGDGKLIHTMAESAIKMVTDSIDAYVKRDTALAGAVIEYDDVVDELFLQVKRSLIALIAEKSDEGEYALDLLMIAKYLERIGDHAVNIAGWVLFSVYGEHIPEGEVGPAEERDGPSER